MEYYADAEGGAYLEDPDHRALAALVDGLNTSDNTFFVVYPADEDLEWFISVSTNVATMFGGYEIERHDPATGERDKSTAADPNVIATDVLGWVNRR